MTVEETEKEALYETLKEHYRRIHIEGAYIKERFDFLKLWLQYIRCVGDFPVKAQKVQIKGIH